VAEIDPGSVVTSEDLATQLGLLFAEQHTGIGSFAAKAGPAFRVIRGFWRL
jgi:hypothetical protein